jgi:hypothetical protein
MLIIIIDAGGWRFPQAGFIIIAQSALICNKYFSITPLWEYKIQAMMLMMIIIREKGLLVKSGKCSLKHMQHECNNHSAQVSAL